MMFGHNLETEFVMDHDAEDAITEAVVAAAGVEPQGDGDDDATLMHYHNTMLTESLSVFDGVYSMIWIAAWAVQNRLHGDLLVPLGWAQNVDDDFVEDHVQNAPSLFGTGPMLEKRRAAGRPIPSCG